MKRVICQVLIAVFSCNILLPQPALFAQGYAEDEYASELYFDDPYQGDVPSPIMPPKEEIVVDTPWAPYAVLSNYKPQEPTEDLLGRPINYNAQKDARAIKRGISTQNANVRQFLANAPKDALLDWLTQNELPQDNMQIGLNEYVPGLHLKRSAGESAKAALKNLTVLFENGELQVEDYISLLSAPSAEIAAFGAMALHSTFQEVMNSQDPSLIYLLLGFVPQIQTAAVGRLDKAYASPQANRAATPGHFLVQKIAPAQTESSQSVEMRGLLNLLLADIYALYRTAKTQEMRPQLQEEEQAMWPRQEYTFFTPDPMPESFYQKQKDRLLHSLDYARTLRERVMGINNERVLNADYVALTLITYDGVSGFKRLVDYIDAENTNLNGSKQQYRLDQYNFPFLKSAFDNLSLLYLPKISSRETGMDPKEKKLLVDTLINYANHGSAPVQVLAMNLLTALYQESSPKWTRGQGYDKGAAGGPAISTQTANQVADRIKKIYCRLDHATQSVYGLNSEQMQEMADQLAIAYRRVRKDPQGYILPANKDGKAVAAQQCYVRDVQTRNQSVQAQEMAADTMNFILTWVAFGGALRLIGKGASYTASVARAANQARKMPVGQRIAYFTGTLKQAKRAQKAARELSQMGVKVERIGQMPAAKPSAFTQRINSLKQKMGMKIKEKDNTFVVDALRETNPKGQTLGYRITQRLPGGKEQITNIEGEVISRQMVTPNIPAKLGAEKGTLNSVTELAEKYVTKLPEGVSPAAYKEAIATENLFRTGLEEVSAANFKSGFGMKQVWYKDAQGKLFSTHEPIWVDLAKSSEVVTNGAGIPLTGTLRKDLIKTVSNPGGVLTATASTVGEGGFRYLWNISKWTGEFAAADVAVQPISEALDGKYQSAPAGAPWYAEVGQYFHNVGNAIINYDQAAGAVIVLPFVAVGKGISWAWDKTIRSSSSANSEEMTAQLEDNPYLKEYRQKTQKLQEAFEKDVLSFVDLWKQVQNNPDNIQLKNKLDINFQQMNDKYSQQQTGGISQQWQVVSQSLAVGVNPFEMQDYYLDDYSSSDYPSEEDFF